MQSWDIDPKTGDYILDAGGNPRQTDSLRVPAYFRLKARRTQWLYAPNERWGADFYLLKKRRSTSDGSAVEAVAALALQPLIDDGRSEEIVIETTAVARQGIALKATITEASGRLETLELPPLRG